MKTHHLLAVFASTLLLVLAMGGCPGALDQGSAGTSPSSSPTPDPSADATTPVVDPPSGSHIIDLPVPRGPAGWDNWRDGASGSSSTGYVDESTSGGSPPADQSPPNPSDSTNPPSNQPPPPPPDQPPAGGDGGGGGAPRDDLPTDAINDVARQLFAAGAALGTYAALADPRIDFGVNRSGHFGTCPHVAFASGVESVGVSLDYGETGCSSPPTAGELVAGIGGMIMLHRSTAWAEMWYDRLAIEGRTVTARVDATFRHVTGGVSLAGTCDVTTNGVGATAGNLTWYISQAGSITFNEADLMITGAASYSATLGSIVFDPIRNRNFVPQAGTVSFVAPTGEPVVITFSARSPLDGTVLVTVGNNPPVEYRIPGIGP